MKKNKSTSECTGSVRVRANNGVKPNTKRKRERMYGDATGTCCYKNSEL